MRCRWRIGGSPDTGPVVVPFGRAFKSKGCVNSTSAVVAAIQSHPSGYDVNVHNATYPGGALRGQLRNDG